MSEDTAAMRKKIADNGTVKVDATKTLNLSGVALSGGSISNLGIIDIIGDSSIKNAAFDITVWLVYTRVLFTSNGTIVTGGTVTDNGAIHVTGDSAINTAAVN